MEQYYISKWVRLMMARSSYANNGSFRFPKTFKVYIDDFQKRTRLTTLAIPCRHNIDWT